MHFLHGRLQWQAGHCTILSKQVRTREGILSTSHVFNSSFHRLGLPHLFDLQNSHWEYSSLEVSLPKNLASSLLYDEWHKYLDSLGWYYILEAVLSWTIFPSKFIVNFEKGRSFTQAVLQSAFFRSLYPKRALEHKRNLRLLSIPRQGHIGICFQAWSIVLQHPLFHSWMRNFIYCK